MKKLQALLVDDEAPARKQMRILLREHPEIEVVGEAEDLVEAEALVAQWQPEVIFLDVQLQNAEGFELLDRLPETANVVFVTAHDHYAVRAFDGDASDYLLKPVHPRRLAATVQRLLKDSEYKPGRHALVVRSGGRIHRIDPDEILWISADGPYSSIQSIGTPPLFVRRSIGEWEEALSNDAFARLDRSLLVNLLRVESVETLDRNSATVKFKTLDTTLSIGRTAFGKLRSLLCET